jgi:hypothetical protein
MGERRSDGDRTPPDRVRQALELLAEEARQRLASHPQGHLLGPGGAIDLELTLPLAPRGGELDEVGEGLRQALGAGLGALLAERAIFRPGHVFCLRCGNAECEHSTPPAVRQVFAGFGPTGLPRFLDFGQWLLDRQDPRVDLLYKEPPRVLSHVARGEELTAALLPPYREDPSGYRLHGQVTAGWFRGTDADGRPAVVAVSLLLASLPTPRGQRHGINVVGTGPGGESLEHFCHRLGRIPWSGPVRWAQSVAEQIGSAKPAAKGGGKGKGEARGKGVPKRRLDGLLAGLSRRLEKDSRARRRRTRHAEQRHDEGDRPTRMALADLERAEEGAVFHDARRDTLVVVGERGRSHVFNPAGKLVTSIRYAPDAIERRRKQGVWRAADGEQIRQLKEQVAAKQR